MVVVASFLVMLAADGDGREPQGKGGSVSRCFAHLVYVKPVKPAG